MARWRSAGATGVIRSPTASAKTPAAEAVAPEPAQARIDGSLALGGRDWRYPVTNRFREDAGC
jgi:hypothetical protein